MSPYKKSMVGGAALLMFWGALAIYTALQPLKPRSQLAYDPIFFPALLIGLGILLSIVIIGQAALAYRRERATTREAENAHDPRRVLTLFVIVGLYFSFMPMIGFIVSSVVFVAVFAVALGYRRWPLVAALSVLGPIAVWFVFTYGLQAPLPTLLGG